ncbi:hypothetical protein HCN08_02350 [Streptomyces sp. PRB2-1]|uniref:Secreted protein n=1 Tax=Actinacidiphila epipremni TaxID=2053013 RepID=A0ABX0ZG38_9ACTN|nr:hypothetical protein [Actinacidiphila epipremni]
MDLGAVGTAVATVLGGAAAWRQSRRSSFTTITRRLDAELRHEREQRRLLAQAYVDLLRWARAVDPGPAGPPPEPPDDLELLPWR